MNFAPRFIRLRDAHRYLGMDKNRFADEVRPYLIEIPIGSQGIAFDRLDLDAWADKYKAGNGRPGKGMKRGSPWGGKSRQDSSTGKVSGTFRRESEAAEFEKALARATSHKRKGT